MRPDLDGRRLISEDKTRTWLVFHGLRHHISSAAVYDSLFRPSIEFEEFSDLDAIAEGPDLTNGTCLVSSAESGEIYLIFGSPSVNIRKHLVQTYETFIAMGFNDSLVTRVPSILLAAIPSGRPIRLEVSL